uniref:winged helix-turn-helix domain-containing protein n=1 Tax=Haloprofundus sp. MHR1 TaxID=2572921 RepID=UPI001F272EF3|nr:winged helix-turn-helix domain-containing protein [Haloprofundus sp. MHR1]
MASEDRSQQVDQRIVESIETLASRQRLEILVALAEKKYATGAETPAMSFTELYDAVDCQSTSQFTYHLKQLVDTFIVETPEGYQLTYAGDKVRRAVFSGLYDSSPAFEPFDIKGTCPHCGVESLKANLANDWFTVECPDCEVPIVSDLFPQSMARGRSPQEIVDSFGAAIWAKFVFVRGGICPECYGRVDTTIQCPEQDTHPYSVAINECRECWFTISMPVDMVVAFHPLVVEAFWRHGVSVLEVPLWELFEYTTAEFWETTVVAEDPFLASVELTVDDVNLSFSVDHTLNVSYEE